MLKFDFVIYPRKLWIGTKEDCLKNFLNGEEKDLDLDNIDSYEALTITVTEKETGQYGYFVILDEVSPSIIGHEATHVALELCKDLDIIVDVGNQEPISYLIGFICKCLSKYEISKK